MSEKYYVIYNSDGDTHVITKTRAELLHALDNGVYGEFISDGWDSDSNYWGDKVMIIKGSIITPVARERVVAYDVV